MYVARVFFVSLYGCWVGICCTNTLGKFIGQVSPSTAITKANSNVGAHFSYFFPTKVHNIGRFNMKMLHILYEVLRSYLPSCKFLCYLFENIHSIVCNNNEIYLTFVLKNLMACNEISEVCYVKQL